MVIFRSTFRREYQGIKPPVERSEENFDAGAKYHVPADVEYLRSICVFLVSLFSNFS